MADPDSGRFGTRRDGKPVRLASRRLTALLLNLAIAPAAFAATQPTQAPQMVPDAPPPSAHTPRDRHAAARHGKTSPAKAEGQAKTPKTAEPKHVPPPVAAVPAVPKPPKEPAEPPLPLPRFASLKTDETNMRRGPGQRYPIDWVYRRRDLPVEVEREYDVWRFVRDSDGVQGWVHEVTLSEQRRTFVVQGADATLRDSPDNKAAPVAVLKVGVIGRFRACDAGSKWCQAQAGGYKGYLRRDQVWGLLPDDVIAP